MLSLLRDTKCLKIQLIVKLWHHPAYGIIEFWRNLHINLQENVWICFMEAMLLGTVQAELWAWFLMWERRSLDGFQFRWLRICFDLSAVYWEHIFSSSHIINQIHSLPFVFEQRKNVSEHTVPSKMVDFLHFFCLDIVLISTGIGFHNANFTIWALKLSWSVRYNLYNSVIENIGCVHVNIIFFISILVFALTYTTFQRFGVSKICFERN